jgi:hypothetical protein
MRKEHHGTAEIGNYDVSLEETTGVITFEKDEVNDEGEMVTKTIGVRMWRYTISVVHRASGVVTVFKHFLHQGVWKWSDSRCSEGCSVEYVIEELGRMLYAGDNAKAHNFLACLLPDTVV